MPRALPPLAVLSALAACGGPAEPPADPTPAPVENGVQVLDVRVDATGFVPDAIALRAGVPARLVFTRTSDGTCATEVLSPALGIPRTDLPLGRPTAVEFTPGAAGTFTTGAAGAFTFACDVDAMVKGAVVVES